MAPEAQTSQIFARGWASFNWNACVGHPESTLTHDLSDQSRWSGSNS